MSTVQAFALLLGLVALVRLGEVIVSARRLRRGGAVSEPWLFPLMVFLHLSSLILPLVEVIGLDRPFVPGLAAGAGGVLFLATLLRVWTLRTLRGAWNVRIVVPADGAVATGGPYAWIRHPNYLVVILELAAIPLLHSAWLSALGLSLLNGFVLSRRIPTEEAELEQLPAWREAMRSRKRLVPGLL